MQQRLEGLLESERATAAEAEVRRVAGDQTKAALERQLLSSEEARREAEGRWEESRALPLKSGFRFIK